MDYDALLASADAASAARADASASHQTQTPQKKAPTTKELLELADGSRAPVEAGRRPCLQCGEDPYALRSQLISCAACAAPAHVGCVGLRAIPFKGATK
eukprot:CAMPEP_0119271776 /NCGR_PEP_ID=MMETSP1329-20130426/8234_1 /TAXON_ID=114041 /ORGANISM="Genus nov. species nov., Strain RCC1024" /LENGTH=98 /DNA_ID=CAMNT_0007271827 /DNA_START=6 /DNA_END=299 /DNA_ORIENTATION=-